jgi:ClpP class serine protease
LSDERVEEIARGRVWTGRQALEIGLVDELGGFETALSLAMELAGLEPEREYTVVEVTPPREDLLPQPFPTDGDRAWKALHDLIVQLNSEHVWALAPWMVRIRG